MRRWHPRQRIKYLVMKSGFADEEDVIGEYIVFIKCLKDACKGSSDPDLNKRIVLYRSAIDHLKQAKKYLNKARKE